MSLRRALVECAVLSVQDGLVFYPCCKGCFSRIDVDQHDTTRYRCFKCGYICMKEQVDYRYRLSLKVTRGRCIFGVTVFGTCLDQFFGIHASGLQRLVEDMEGPVGASTRATLLMKAVKDCFIGRHFIFGIKMTSTESGLFVGEPVTNGSSCKDTVQFVTSQMILPTAASLRGCTVVSYYRILLQKAAEYEQGSTDSGKNPGNPETALLLIAHQSPASSFNNTTLSTAGLLCLSPQRSHHHESTLTPTPPWQQSLGLITSSAEQEEGCSTQVSGEENSRLTDNRKTSQYARRSFLESHKVTRERTLSPLLSLEHSSYRSPLFAKYPQMSSEKDGKNTAILNTCFSPSKPVHKGDLPLSCEVREFSSRQLTNSSLSSSLAWENLPFSESLSEFLCEDQDYDIVGETEPHLNVQNQNETVGNNVEIKSQNSNFQFESISVSNSNTQMMEINPRILLNITNTPALTKEDNTHGLSDQLCKNSGECQNKSQVRSFCFHPSEQDSTEDTSLYSENKEEEQLEVDKYDCSADLFSCSTVSNMKTETLNVHAETVSFTEGSPRISSLHKQQMSEKASTPGKERLKSNKCINRDSLISPGKEDLDFIPPAQSTPIVKVGLVSGPPVFLCSSSPSGALSPQSDGQDLCTSYDQPELDSKRLTKTTPSICKLNSGNRHDHKSTPKRFWKPNRHKNHPLDYQHPRVQRGSLHLGSKVRTKHKIDSSICDMTVFDYEDNEVIVPPTPAKTRLSVKRRRREQIGNSSSDLDSPWKMQQEHEVNCKRNMLDQHLSSLTSSQRGMAQTGNCDSEVACEGSLNGSNGCLFDDENQTCDWSRDLFSNSI